MQTNTIAPPPVVKVAGKDYHVRFSNGAFYQLSSWGFDVNDVVGHWNGMLASGHAREGEGQLAAASLGTMDAQGNWTSLGLSPMALADKCSEEEYATIRQVAWEQFRGKFGLVLTTEAKKTDTPLSDPKPDGSNAGPSQSVPADSE